MGLGERRYQATKDAFNAAGYKWASKKERWYFAGVPLAEFASEFAGISSVQPVSAMLAFRDAHVDESAADTV